MLISDSYAVYNHSKWPGIGRDLLGREYYNCFSITLQKNSAGEYLPYLFNHFLKQYNDYEKFTKTCESCITKNKVLSLPVEGNEIDLSAFEKKFSDFDEDVDEAKYYYCPLIYNALKSSKLNALDINSFSSNLPANPIRAILHSNWDDEYLFEFQEIAPARTVSSVCLIIKNLISLQPKKFVDTPAERKFLGLWILAMFYCMETARQSGKKVYLEEVDLNQFQSKLTNFVFPVPQAWVRVIPPPPPDVDWMEWKNQHQLEGQPQRVDFLFTYRGKRHIIELDGNTHYSSERDYRQTLRSTRWLRMCGFEVHRFTNEEISELSKNTHDVLGFIRLLQMEGLEPQEMVFL